MSTDAYPTGTIEVAKGVYAFIQPGGSTDAGFIVDEQGVVVIDTLMTRSLAEELVQAIAGVTKLPIKYIVNTHWHGDHTFGNAVLPRVPIIAHDTCRDDLLIEWDSHRQFLKELYPAAWPGIEDLPAVPPDVTFGERLTLHLTDRKVELMFLGRAHTRGDVVVHLPADGVTFAGDVAFHRYIPNARDGFPSEWVAVAATVEALDTNTIVPGHGAIGTRRDLGEMRECIELVNGQVRRSFDRGATEAEAHAAVRLGPFASWGRQEDRLPTWVGRMYRELRGELG